MIKKPLLSLLLILLILFSPGTVLGANKIPLTLYNGIPGQIKSGDAVGIAKGGIGLTTVAAGSILGANTLDTIAAITSTVGLTALQNNVGTVSWATVTGTGSPVYSISPTLVTPNIGAATGTSLTLSGLTSGSVLFAGTGGAISQSNADIFWDDVNKRLGMGTASPADLFHVASTSVGADRGMIVSAHNASAGAGATFAGRRSRGTNAAPTIVSSGDTISQFYARGFDGAAWKDAARIDLEVDATVGTNDMPGRILFYTTLDGAAESTERVRIGNNGNISISTGTITFPTGGSPGLIFGQGTAFSAMGANTAGIQAKDVAGTAEMFAVDEAANATQISPHDSLTGKWIFYSCNGNTNKCYKVEMEDLVAEVERLSGKTFSKRWTEKGGI